MNILVVSERFDPAATESRPGGGAVLTTRPRLAAAPDPAGFRYVFVHGNNADAPLAALRGRPDWATLKHRVVVTTGAVARNRLIDGWRADGLAVLLRTATPTDFARLRWDRVGAGFQGTAADLVARVERPAESRGRVRALLFLTQGYLVAEALSGGLTGPGEAGLLDEIGWAEADRTDAGAAVRSWAAHRPDELAVVRADLDHPDGWRAVLGLPAKARPDGGAFAAWERMVVDELGGWASAGAEAALRAVVGWLRDGTGPLGPAAAGAFYRAVRAEGGGRV